MYMEPAIKSSFIPEDTQRMRAPKPKGGAADLLILAALVLFIASIALAVGVFLYGQYLGTSQSSKRAQLERAQAAFEPSLIQTLTRLDDRMHAADSILGTHMAPSLFFHILEQVTLSSVAFSKLTFDAVDSQHITIKMRGLAESVNAIALQADLFTKNGVITSPIFSNIDREIEGVLFDVTALVNQNAIRYTSLFSSALPFNQVPADGQVPVSQQAPEGLDPFGSYEE